MLAVPVGLLATAILMVNNIRDLETDRRAGKKTLAVRLGRDARPARLRAAGLPRLRHRAAGLAARRRAPDAVAAAAVARAADRGADRPDRPQPRRRPLAQRRTGPHGHAAARVLHPALRRAAALALMVKLSVRTVRYALRAPLRASWGEIREREVLRVRLDLPDGLYGEGESAPLEPYDGVSIEARTRRARRLRASCSRDDRADRGRARRLPRRARPPPGARGDRHGALGPRRHDARSTPLAKLIHPLAADEVRGQRDDRRRRPRRRGRPRPPQRRRATASAA